jgi:LPS-assembly lipoprotein
MQKIRLLINSLFIKALITALITTLISGCGFRLRGDYFLPPELQTLYVSSVDTHGELTRLVKRHLTINQVNVLSRSKADTPELHILKDKLDRRTLSVFENGQVAEYELIYSVRYQLRFANKDPLNFSFELNRDYQDDPDIALAKSRELSLLLSEMRQQAADRILREMASIQID